MKSKNYMVIMAGGKGTRLWPMSRNQKPKQLQKLITENSMIQETYNRVIKMYSPKKIFISTNKSYVSKIQKQLPKIPRDNYIVEPMMKNTAPAIGLSAIKIMKRDSKAIISTIHADHLIAKVSNFLSAIEASNLLVAKHPKLIGTVGIKPTFAHTGLGYIKSGKKITTINKIPVYHMDKFVEKPNLKRAEAYVSSGKFSWNAGYFTFKAQTLLDNFKKYEPKIYNQLVKIMDALDTKQENKILEKEFAKMPELAIDYLIEKLDTVFTIAADLGWNDIGSWQVIQEILSKETGLTNIERGNHIGIDNQDSLIYAQDKLIATIGLKNIIVVDTGDAILVCNKSRSQDVKKIIEKLETDKKYKKYL